MLIQRWVPLETSRFSIHVPGMLHTESAQKDCDRVGKAKALSGMEMPAQI